MKSVSAIIAISMILMIVVSIASLFWISSSSMFKSVTKSGTTGVNRTLTAISSCMSLESISNNKVFIRNCGRGFITNDSLNVYLDDIPVSFNMTPSLINEGEIATVSLRIWGIPIEQYTLKITNPNIRIITQVESILPDSTVLVLDFEEGSGNKAYDKSGYNNHGTLLPAGSEPQWINGKFHKALNFDGVNDYIQIPWSNSLNIVDQITIATWVYPKSLSSWKNIFFKDNWNTGYKLGFYNDHPIFTLFGLWDAIATGTVPLDTWSYIAATYDRQNVRIYINGVLDTTIVHTDQIGTEISMFYVNSYDVYNFSGNIDSLRVFNKALTPEETVILKLK